MKKFTKTLFIFSVMLVSVLAMGKVTSAQVIEVNATNFPDEGVRSALKEYAVDDTVGDDSDSGFKIDTDKITELSLGGWDYDTYSSISIKDLTGIELLTKLNKLYIDKFVGTTVNLDNSELRSIILYRAGNCEQLQIQVPKLQELQVQVWPESNNSNSFKSIDISKCTELTSLSLPKNKLKSIDVSKNTELTTLDLSWNLLKTIDISKNTKLTTLSLYWNQLKTIDVSKNTKLTTLQLGSNQFKSIDVSQYKTLTTLDLSDNPLTSIDVSKNTKLTSLVCYSTKITSLNLKKNTKLASLSAHHTKLKSLNLEKNKELTSLYVGGTKLTSLDLTKNTKLASLYVSDTKLTSLDLTKNKKLTWLNVSDTKLTSLDLTKNTKLQALYFDNTKIKSLNLKKNKELRAISFYGTPIKLDLTGYNNLTIYFYDRKVGDTINLTPYLGTGYECELSDYDKKVIEYNKSKNTIKIKGKTYSFLKLTKGKKQYTIIVHAS